MAGNEAPINECGVCGTEYYEKNSATLHSALVTGILLDDHYKISVL